MPPWTNTYNGPGNGQDSAKSIAVGGNGNVYVTGSSSRTNGSDYATIGYTSAGEPLWTNRYNGPGNGGGYASGIAVGGNGNVYVTGSSSGTNGNSDYATIGYTSAGEPLWTNRYNGPGNGQDSANSIAVGGNGNVYVTGQSVGTSGYFDYATIGYTSAGVPLWTNRYDGKGDNDYARSIAVGSNGNVYVTGQSVGIGSADYATIGYTSAGLRLWENRYHGSGNGYDSASSIAVGGNGNVYVTGRSGGTGGYNDYATIGYTSAGVPLWTNRYNGPAYSYNYDEARSIAVGSNGNVYVTGQSVGTGGNDDYATIGYTSAGETLWINRFNGPGNTNDYAFSIAVGSNGNVYVTGQSYGANDSGYATIGYTSAGLPLWVNRYHGSGNGYDSASSIAVGSNGNVYVTGSSTGTNGGIDWATIGYSDPPIGAPVVQVDGQLPPSGTITVINSAVVTMLGTYASGLIYYTLDGSQPDFNSSLYSGPITLTNSAVIRALGLDLNTFATAEAPAVTLTVIRVAYPVAALSAGGGRAVVSPAQPDYLSNSVVTVTATSSNGWSFLRWSGDTNSTSNPLSFRVMWAMTNVQAVFGTVIATNAIGGRMQLNTNNPIAYGTSVQVTAIPSNAWYFVQWGGVLTGTSNPATFTVTSTNPVQAVFDLVRYPVSVFTAGGGTVGISPAQTNYLSNSVVTVTATNGNGWSFLRWAGDTNSTSNPLSFPVRQAMTNVQAVFGAVIATNAIGGRVQLNTTNPIAYGTVVQATVVPSNGCYFVQWGGALSGSISPTNFTVTTTNSVQAVFTPPAFATTAGGGSVAIAPAQLNYPGASILSVTATPSNGWVFLNWSGDASGTNNPLSLTMDAPKNVSASFGTALSTAVVGSGSIELNAANPVAYGTSVRATALPSNNSYFVQWGSALTGTNNPSSFTVTNTNVVRAVFSTLPVGSYALTVRQAGSGAGGVAVNPLKAYYALNDSVTLTATALGGTNQFTGWTGDFTGTNNPLILTMNTSKVVTAGFVFGLPRLQAGVTNGTAAGVNLKLTGQPGFNYVLQMATNLTAPVQWQSLRTNAADGGGVWQFTETNLNQEQKFYRVTTP